MFGIGVAMAQLRLAQLNQERELKEEKYAMATMTPEQFSEWRDRRDTERRHRELCAAIRQAGNNARPKGGFFGGFY